MDDGQNKYVYHYGIDRNYRNEIWLDGGEKQ